MFRSLRDSVEFLSEISSGGNSPCLISYLISEYMIHDTRLLIVYGDVQHIIALFLPVGKPGFSDHETAGLEDGYR